MREPGTALAAPGDLAYPSTAIGEPLAEREHVAAGVSSRSGSLAARVAAATAGSPARPWLRSWGGSALLALGLVAVALLVRWGHVTALPFDFHAARQYHSAQLARSYYVLASDAPEWQKTVARVRLREDPPIELPIFQAATAAAYGVAGGERLWIPRLASALFWIAGGLFLFLLARRFAPAWSAAGAVALYLFLPFPLVASTSFQPDPLMVLLLLGALLAAVRHHERPGGGRLAAATALAGAAVLVKPGIAAFFVFPVFAALAVVRYGLRGALRAREFYVFPALGFLPAGGLYLYSALAEQFVTGRIQGSVNPGLWRHSYYWRGWLDSVTDVLRPPFFGDRAALLLLAVGLAAILVARTRAQRAILLALWGGYAAFGLVVSNYVSTHNYYSLPLVPVLALSLALVAGVAADRLRGPLARRRMQAAAAVLVLGLAAAAVGLKAGSTGLALPRPDRQAEERIAVYEEIGRLVDHTPRALVLGGTGLWHHGWIAGRYWPDRSDLAWERDQDRIRPLTADERFVTTDERYYPAVRAMRPPPEVFVVAEPFELALQPDLAVLLSGFPVLAESPDYLIFDLRRRATGDEPSPAGPAAPSFYRLPPEWDGVERGMSREDVRRLVGAPDRVERRTDLRRPVEVWLFEPGNRYAIVFVEGRLFARAQRFR